jgi:UPF0755 protein
MLLMTLCPAKADGTVTEVKTVLVVCFVILVCVSSFFSWYIYQILTTPGPPLRHSVVIFVHHGSSLRKIAQTLAVEGVITNPNIFSLWGRLSGADRKIQGGEYLFTVPLPPLAILQTLISGKGLRHAVTVTEGMTFKQIVDLLTRKGFGTEEQFLCLNTDPFFLNTLGLPPEGIEGYLYPDTYHFSWLASPEEILGRMVERFHKAMSPTIHRQIAAQHLSLHEITTLASLIEKETTLRAERSLVAAVFHNRLHLGMPLQCDPSVIYGLEDFDGNLTRQHLLTPTLYNTYLFRGLPPGPIASPGLESILAALNPAKLDYLYFVAKGDGSHEFSSDLEAHNRAVYQLQRKRF